MYAGWGIDSQMSTRYDEHTFFSSHTPFLMPSVVWIWPEQRSTCQKERLIGINMDPVSLHRCFQSDMQSRGQK